MIIKEKENWFKMLFVWHGSVLPQLLPRLVLLFMLSLIIVYFEGIIFTFKVPLNPAPLTLFGFVLALFLGFRNNVSYERFWEGRKLWGALLNHSRSLARQCITLTNKKGDHTYNLEFISLLRAFPYVLKHQLRNTSPENDLKTILNEEQYKIVAPAHYKPIILAKLMAQWIQNARKKNTIDSIQQARFDENLDALTQIVGGCERIRSTPIPYTYRVLLHRTIYIYCFLLPFGLVDNLGWLTPFIVTFIAYTFVAFEAIADEIEEPFGIKQNDLALNAMSEMIDDTISEIAGILRNKMQEQNKDIFD